MDFCSLYDRWQPGAGNQHGCLISSSIMCNEGIFELRLPVRTGRTKLRFPTFRANISRDITVTDVLEFPGQAGVCRSDGSG